MKKPSLSRSIWKLMCPKCRTGKMFQNSSHYSSNFTKMYRKCESCQQDFTPEPGFYFGAAYVSYAISMLLCGLGFLIAFFILGYRAATPLIITILIPVIILMPVNFRLSRCIWLYIFVRYRGH